MIPDLIYDVGMHNGDDTAHYLQEGYRVVGIEANPVLAESCRRRFAAAITCERLVVLNVGISAKEGIQTFWVNPMHTEFSSFLPDVACRNGQETRPMEIQTVPFASILAKYGVPFYLKSDIEKHDVYCLNALNSRDLPAYVSIEAHELSYLSILRGLGYNAFKCVDQTAHNLHRDFGPTWLRWGRRKALRVGELLRIYRPTFPRGSSGPFGNAVPGRWQSLDNVAAEWNRALPGGTLYRFGWFDFHATIQERTT